jgi:hypothetical protein
MFTAQQWSLGDIDDGKDAMERHDTQSYSFWLGTGMNIRSLILYALFSVKIQTNYQKKKKKKKNNVSVPCCTLR